MTEQSSSDIAQTSSASIIERAKASQASSLVESQASAPSPLSSDGSVLPDVLARLSALEAKVEAFITHTVGAIEHASLGAELDELKAALHSFASSQFAHDTTSHLQAFKDWWKSFFTSAPASPPPPTVLTAGGASVTNEVQTK